MDEDVHGDQL